MASRFQNAWTRLLSLNAAELGRATEGDASDGDVRAGWLDVQTNGHHRKGRRESSFVHGVWVQIAYALIDICLVVIAGIVAFFLRFSPADLRHFFVSGRLTLPANQPLSPYGGFLLVYVTMILLFCEWQDLYRTPRTRTAREESFAVVKAVSFATLLLTAFIYLSGVKIVSRLIVLNALLLNIVLLAAWRYFKRRVVIHRVEQGMGSRNVVIIGAGAVGQALARQLDESKHLGYRFKGFLDENHSDNPRTLGKIEDLPRVARANFLDEVFITIPSERELVKRIAIEARQHRLDVKVVPELYDGLGWHAPIRQIGDFPVMDLHWEPIPTLGFFVKRILDISVSVLALGALSPLMAVLVVLIRKDSSGPIFYRSARMGRKGRVFTCYKFRTMVANADQLKDGLRHRNERDGAFFKISDDPRVTGLGRFLRRYSLDELPQLWNVLRGDMSLVGPRPHPLDDYRQYSLDDLRRLEVRPGLTGLWQIKARRDPSFETNMRLDLGYIDHWNLWLDLKILALTLPTVMKGEGQ